MESFEISYMIWILINSKKRDFKLLSRQFIFEENAWVDFQNFYNFETNSNICRNSRECVTFVKK